VDARSHVDTFIGFEEVEDGPLHCNSPIDEAEIHAYGHNVSGDYYRTLPNYRQGQA